MATLLVASMLLIRLALDPYVAAYRALFFLPAVVVASAILGRPTGLYTALLSTFAVLYFLTEPAFSFAIQDERAGLGLALFLSICVSLSVFTNSLHSALQLSWTRATRAELRLAELQHRMRNNLQIASALLIRQGRDASEETRTALRAAADRIGSLASIEDRTSQALLVGDVDTRALIEGLCADIRESLVGIRPIAMEVKVVADRLPAADVPPLGLIINELVTNAMKYAFPDDRVGTVWVNFIRIDDDFELTVADNGIGIHGRGNSESGGLGSVLIRAMAGQLGGNVEQGTAKVGTSWIVRLPARKRN
ncbi:histidine kinase dimerization/phosphoacceptor domain -containing protein [Allosphingosinicella deserti]|uniref:histidine kinase dimerization/phosphoacceptor domain -containing protein n=1 Tax=Allosphingosinicella deserti TaxID=2116704 RepID=UPI001304A232|nr:histidine kinase dimerization/phosphoacceptor domain -containing protein [Sphingomonas deserti]